MTWLDSVVNRLDAVKISFFSDRENIKPMLAINAVILTICNFFKVILDCKCRY